MLPEKPLWSILIATLASRRDKFQRLMDVLLPQAEKAECIEVIACHNNGEKPLGAIRQALMEEARGEYLSFLDDDDMVPDYFVPKMLSALWQKPDVVGLYMRYYESGHFIANSYHSIGHESHNTTTAFYRDLSHQQPVRSVLARKGDFRAAWPEDNAWKTAVRPLLRTEVYVDEMMYHYYHNGADTVQGNLAPHTFTERAKISSPVFRWMEIEDVHH